MKDKLCNKQSYTLSNMSFFKTPKLHSSWFFFGNQLAEFVEGGRAVQARYNLYNFQKIILQSPKGEIIVME